MAVVQQDPVRYAMATTAIGINAIDRVWVATAGGTSFADETADANNATAADVPLGGAVNDALYLCQDEQFASVYVDMSTNASGGTRVLEYYNGTTWTSLTATFQAGAVLLSADSVATWNIPSDWTAVAVNGDPARYAIRFRTATTNTTAGTITRIGLSPLIPLSGGGKTLTLSSTTSRSFRQVLLQVDLHTSSLASCDRILVRCRFGSGAWTNAIDMAANAPLVNTESATWTFNADLTALFTADFGAGSSATFHCEVALGVRESSGTASSANATAGLTINYDSDETDATQMGSIAICCDSLTGNLGTSLTTLGSVPDWSAFLPETGVTILDQWIELEGNTDEAGTTDWSIAARADAEGEVTVVTYDASQQSDSYVLVRWSRADLSAAAAHTLDFRVTSASGALLTGVGIRICCTYSFTGGTRRTRHRRIPFLLNSGIFKGTAAGDAAKADVPFWVPEKTPTLVQSGIVLYTHQTGDPGSYVLKMGSGSARTYTTAAATTTGPIPYHQRFDSGGAGGSGISFARGKNTLTITGYANTTPANGGGEFGFVDLVYTYEVESGKRLTPWERCHFPTAPVINAGNANRTSSVSVAIGPTDYQLSDIGVLIHANSAAGGTVTGEYGIERTNGGWTSVYLASNPDPVFGVRVLAGQLIDRFRRTPGEVDTDRVDIETAHNETLWGFSRSCAVLCASHHNYTYTISKQVTGSNGGTVEINLHDALTHELLAQTSRVGDGTYTFTWYDDTREVYTVAREDNTHLSRSANFTAGT